MSKVLETSNPKQLTGVNKLTKVTRCQETQDNSAASKKTETFVPGEFEPILDLASDEMRQ